MIIAPNTIKGERKKRRKKRLTPVCSWLTSPVRRLMSVGTPRRSISEKESACACAKTLLRTDAAKPVAAFAEKNCAVTATPKPTSPSRIISSTRRVMNALSPAARPTSMMDATTMGTNSSNTASSSLKNGAKKHSLRYFFKKGNSFFKIRTPDHIISRMALLRFSTWK